MPTSRELEQAVVSVLISQNGTLSNEDISRQVIALLQIPTDVQEVMHSASRTELEYRLAWARTRASRKRLVERVARKTWKAVG